ncbi:hypothetical protein ACWN8V_07655 [Vagococcus elongatus]|uniref:Uncharacterized protein n=1 Tax=Vagococcus elongatus TaxID=180344 RepID=A0A430AU31_9ENTE|nr:hypothetical protein [Vagococcus elongatus]RSU11567.1 hypothetical protein CBF29_07755 [Vagococcus elongatus]
MNEILLPIKRDYFPIKLQFEDGSTATEEFRFSYSDENIKRFYNGISEVTERIDKISEKEAADVLGEISKADEWLKEGYDFILGQGSYEIIKKHQPSILNRKALYLTLVEFITKAINDFKEEQDRKEAEMFEIDK